MAVNKFFIPSDELRHDSYLLAAKIIDDDFIPDFLVALWRGGAPIGCHIHEYFKYLNHPTDHIAIRTSRYTGIDTVSESVAVHNLGYLEERVTKESKILLIDDVFDSGKSIEAVLLAFKEHFGDQYPSNIRIATVYYKAERNTSSLVPDYYIHQTKQWIVFPHELEDMTFEEIAEHRGPAIASALKRQYK